MRAAFIHLSRGDAILPLRTNMELPQSKGRALIMPVYLPAAERFGVKLVSIMDGNPGKGLPLIHAMMMVVDTATGKPIALQDGEHLTALRTGAASGLATDLLAHPDACRLAIIGVGAQARFQLEAIAYVRKISVCHAIGRSIAGAQKFADAVQAHYDFPILPTDKRDVLRETDILCTATTATEPVFSHADIRAGVQDLVAATRVLENAAARVWDMRWSCDSVSIRKSRPVTQSVSGFAACNNLRIW